MLDKLDGVLDIEIDLESLLERFIKGMDRENAVSIRCRGGTNFSV